jgi:hypothetical protein
MLAEQTDRRDQKDQPKEDEGKPKEGNNDALGWVLQPGTIRRVRQKEDDDGQDNKNHEGEDQARQQATPP